MGTSHGSYDMRVHVPRHVGGVSQLKESIQTSAKVALRIVKMAYLVPSGNLVSAALNEKEIHP